MPSIRAVAVVVTTAGLALACGVDGESPLDTTDGVGENHVGSCYPDDGEFAVANGRVTTSGADIAYSDASLSLQLSHKLDVDEVEGGCIAAATLVLDEVEGGFCLFELDFEGSAEGLVLVAAGLALNSECPGWLDAVEGYYLWEGAGSAALEVPPVPEPGAPYYCYDVHFEPAGEITLVAEGLDPIVVDLGGLSIDGFVQSTGNDALQCPG